MGRQTGLAKLLPMPSSLDQRAISPQAAFIVNAARPTSWSGIWLLLLEARMRPAIPPCSRWIRIGLQAPFLRGSQPSRTCKAREVLQRAAAKQADMYGPS